RRDPEAHVRDVRLLVGHQELREPRRVAHEHHEQSRRQRIERAGVADARGLQGAAHDGHDVVRRRAGGFVDEKGAVHVDAHRITVTRNGHVATATWMRQQATTHGRVWTPTAIACSSSSSTPSRTTVRGPLSLKPAAFLWPPPPWRAAMARTSTSYFERMLMWMSPSAPILKKTTA